MWWSEDFSTDNDYIKYEIGFEEISTSIADNTSVVNVRVWVYRTNTGYTTYGNGTVYCTVNGILYTSNISNSQGITHDGIVVFNICGAVFCSKKTPSFEGCFLIACF